MLLQRQPLPKQNDYGMRAASGLYRRVDSQLSQAARRAMQETFHNSGVSDESTIRTDAHSHSTRDVLGGSDAVSDLHIELAVEPALLSAVA